MRISHSHYLGGPPMWTAEDRAKVEAWREWNDGVCTSCGTHRDWWDPKAGGDRFAFIADTFRCGGCEVKEETREQIPKDTRGVHVFLTPNPELLEEARRGR